MSGCVIVEGLPIGLSVHSLESTDLNCLNNSYCTAANDHRDAY